MGFIGINSQNNTPFVMTLKELLSHFLSQKSIFKKSDIFKHPKKQKHRFCPKTVFLSRLT
ncbi:hypothetical protein AO373_1651 [Moraxella catarrhalis]|nr:hypothetical protein AO381_1620 [Moraxella catarrhalis]OAV06633.1 hypothetical protein AO379_0763 [Moraxella catarrhalis]OAV17841.1 hypothetical protein AO373_1651 [Moraxella catarrhalis]